MKKNVIPKIEIKQNTPQNTPQQQRYSRLKEYSEQFTTEDAQLSILKGALLLDNETSKYSLQLKLHNNSDSVIQSVYFNLACYNDANELIVKDIKAEYSNFNANPNEDFGTKQLISVPSFIFKFEISDIRIVYSDNKIQNYHNMISVPPAQPITDILPDYLRAFISKNNSVNVVTQKIGDNLYWCTCGNLTSNNYCKRCKRTFEKSQNDSTIQAIESNYRDYLKLLKEQEEQERKRKEAELAERKRREQEQKEKLNTFLNSKKFKIAIFVVSIVLIIISAFTIGKSVKDIIYDYKMREDPRSCNIAYAGYTDYRIIPELWSYSGHYIYYSDLFHSIENSFVKFKTMEIALSSLTLLCGLGFLTVSKKFRSTKSIIISSSIMSVLLIIVISILLRDISMRKMVRVFSNASTDYHNYCMAVERGSSDPNAYNIYKF